MEYDADKYDILGIKIHFNNNNEKAIKPPKGTGWKLIHIESFGRHDTVYAIWAREKEKQNPYR